MLKLYNSLTDKKQVFKPRAGKKVHMFVCGITPYDSPHIGNMRTFINYDLLARYLRFLDYDVFYLQNLTDIDDKIIASSKKLNISWREVSKRYFSEFLTVCKSLNITGVTKYAKATQSIKEIIKQIQVLIKKGYAYQNNGSVYFEVKKFKRYGSLSHQKLEKLHASERLEHDPNKKHPYDFVLWKAKKDGEPFWKSPWGPGRPGWHIEDTALSEKYFGAQYDIHGGAVELKFPHHEAEIAQQESASGKKPMVRYWVHSGILMINGEKMSKSLNNFVTGSAIIQQHHPDDFRFMIISAHYRSIIDYTDKLITQAHTTLKSIRFFTQELKTLKTKVRGDFHFNIEPYSKKFFAALNDDLNTPLALSVIFILIRDVRAHNNLSLVSIRSILAFLNAVEQIFGINLTKPITYNIPLPIIEKAQLRELMRKDKKWTEADVLRNEILSAGYTIKDISEGFEIIPVTK